MATTSVEDKNFVLTDSEVPSSNLGRQPVLAAIGKRILAKDYEAESELYAYILRGVSFWLRFSNSVDLRSDIAHDVFIICLRAIREGRIHDLERLPGFVLTVVKRQIAKQKCELARDAVRFEEFRGETFPDIRTMPFGGIEYEEKRKRTLEALEALSTFDRELLVRFYFLGETPETIMGAMSITYTQFRVSKHRAKSRLLERIRYQENSRQLKKLAAL